jgi:hypothetical protein
MRKRSRYVLKDIPRIAQVARWRLAAPPGMRGDRQNPPALSPTHGGPRPLSRSCQLDGVASGRTHRNRWADLAFRCVDDISLAASWGHRCDDIAARSGTPPSVAIEAQPVHPKECAPLNPCPVSHKQQAATGRGRNSFECMGRLWLSEGPHQATRSKGLMISPRARSSRLTSVSTLVIRGSEAWPMYQGDFPSAFS